MKLSVQFPVTNDVRVNDEFPLENGSSTFFMDVAGGRVQSVGITRSGLSSDLGPKIEDPKSGEGNRSNAPVMSIHIGGGDIVKAIEERIRAWRALQSPIVQVEIDFRAPTIRYFSEDGEDIPLKSFSTGPHNKPSTLDEFGIFGRAFLATESQIEISEIANFYLDGIADMDAGRFVHAYNHFFLLLESMFGNGKFKEKELVENFMTDNAFMQAFAEACESAESSTQNGLPFALENLNDSKLTISNLVKRRGFLRHHSMKNKWRWRPSEQESYRLDALFLAQICRLALSGYSTTRIWREDVAQEFMEKAHSMGIKIEVGVELTVWQNGIPQIVAFPTLVYPQKTMSPPLALEVIGRVLEEHRNNHPEIEIASIRSFDKRSGVELFRYSVGTSVAPRRD